MDLFDNARFVIIVSKALSTIGVLTSLSDLNRVVTELKEYGLTIPVRCEECVHYKPQKQSFKWAGTVKYCVRSAAVKMPPDGFCSCGERKGDGNV